MELTPTQTLSRRSAKQLGKSLEKAAALHYILETCEGCENLADISCEWYPRMVKEALTDGLAIWDEKRM